MDNRFDNSLNTHAQALLLRSRRATVLATNLANADTPNYLARDVDFRTSLDSALNGGQLAATDPRHLQGQGAAPGALRYRVPIQPAIDGNTVEAHLEKAAFADNAVRYQASLELLNSRIRGLLGAIKGE